MSQEASLRLECGMRGHLDGCGGAGKSDKCACSLVLHRRAGGLQQVVNAADEAGTL